MQRRLARLDSARKEFIANASHELRTPIFSLGGFVELLETEDPEPESASRVRRADARADRAAAEADHRPARPLQARRRRDGDRAERRSTSASSRARSPPSSGPIADAARLAARGAQADGQAVARGRPRPGRQIIRILLDNALTHTPRGNEGDRHRRARPRARAELIVGDDGPGIDAASLERVFDRFYTGDTASGSGLGLAIARRARAADGRRARGRLPARASPPSRCACRSPSGAAPRP